MKQQIFLSSMIFVLYFLCLRTFAQTPNAVPAQPAPSTSVQTPSAQVPPETSGSPDVVKILNKASHFTIFVRLLKATGEDSELFTELNTTTNGITVLVPNDNAFAQLKVGTLNELSDKQKTELVKFHVLPKFIASSQFQTETNPVKTQAGSGGRVSLNVTTTGDIVNITSGLTNATIQSTVYTDNQLAIYEVDKVLLPAALFSPNSPAPAPEPAGKPKTKKEPQAAESPIVPNKDVSGTRRSVMLYNVMFVTISIACAALSSL